MAKDENAGVNTAPDIDSIGADDDEVIDLLEVVKPGKAVAKAPDGDEDFSADLESMLDTLSKAEQEKAAEEAAVPKFPDPTPVDHEVDHDESLELPGMDDFDDILNALGASAPESTDDGGDEAAVLPDLPDLDAMPVVGAPLAKEAPEPAAHGLSTDDDLLAEMGISLPKEDPLEDAGEHPLDAAPSDLDDDLLAELGVAAPAAPSAATPDDDLLAELGVAAPAEPTSTVPLDDDLLAELGVAAPEAPAAPESAAALDDDLLAELGVAAPAEPAPAAPAAALDDDLLAELGVAALAEPAPAAAPDDDLLAELGVVDPTAAPAAPMDIDDLPFDMPPAAEAAPAPAEQASAPLDDDLLAELGVAAPAEAPSPVVDEALSADDLLAGLDAAPAPAEEASPAETAPAAALDNDLLAELGVAAAPEEAAQAEQTDAFIAEADLAASIDTVAGDIASEALDAPIMPEAASLDEALEAAEILNIPEPDASNIGDVDASDALAVDESLLAAALDENAEAALPSAEEQGAPDAAESIEAAQAEAVQPAPAQPAEAAQPEAALADIAQPAPQPEVTQPDDMQPTTLEAEVELPEVAAPAAQPEAAAPSQSAPAAELTEKESIAALAEMEDGQDSGGRFDEVDLNELDALLDDMLASAPISGPAPVMEAPEPEPPVVAPVACLAPETAANVDLSMEVSSLRLDIESLREEIVCLQGGEIPAAQSGADAAKLEDLELTLAAQAASLQTFDDRLLVIEGKLNDLNANIDKIAAEAAAKVIREELAALISQ